MKILNVFKTNEINKIFGEKVVETKGCALNHDKGHVCNGKNENIECLFKPVNRINLLVQR